LIVPRSAAGATVMDRVFNAEDEIANASEHGNNSVTA
jgi:hypothetical protein